MTAIDAGAGPLSEAEHRAQLRRAMIASTVGTTIEWYDFLLYGTVTALVFGKLYFPHSDPLVGVLEAFSVFFVGFVGRPIGAAIFGHFGDRIGRKATLIATLLVTGIATFAVGLVPGYVVDRHLGCGAADRHPLDPRDRGRRRMGRLGAAGDGMGANQQASRLHLVLAAIRRAGRAVPGQSGGAGVQLAVRRPVPDLGLAHPVLHQHHHGRGRAVDPARDFRNPGVPEDPRRRPHRARAGVGGAQAPAQAGGADRIAAHAGAGAGLYRRRVHLHLWHRGAWARRATSY